MFTLYKCVSIHLAAALSCASIVSGSVAVVSVKAQLQGGQIIICVFVSR